MSRVVHPCLDALVQGPVAGGAFVPQLGIDGWGKGSSHAVIVLAEVWEVRALGESHTTHKQIINKNTIVMGSRKWLLLDIVFIERTVLIIIFSM